MRVLIFDQVGNVLQKFGCSKHLEFPNGVVVNDKQEIFISDNRAHCVKVFNYEGAFLRQIGGEGLTNYPIGMLTLWKAFTLANTCAISRFKSTLIQVRILHKKSPLQYPYMQIIMSLLSYCLTAERISEYWSYNRESSILSNHLITSHFNTHAYILQITGTPVESA